jgi:hypothetical protein
VKMDFKDKGYERPDLSSSGKGSVPSCCERNNVSPNSVEEGKCVDKLSNRQRLNKAI